VPFQIGFSKIGPPEGRTLFQPSDQEGLKVVNPLKLKVKPSATFRMQPCRFVREDTLQPQGVIEPVRVRGRFNT